ncbi:MAG: UDP-3-O-[3-hydroxymyristoyl] N-acetylglucosamine deacetylase [Candidatus Rokubacteria bacterium]|jgi:UDP-3-O-[3-hydroxymyristoyl] N-acetylglucosamine deacetylase|nr:UDP-3-O-[3-hydroxymyristoyl] N-acetylglucosamine deacetylase [Candidatus Rokubacteria bacterium]
MELQHTIRKVIACRGVGLHTGIPVTMTLCPAPPDHGVVFRILPSGARVPVRPESLVNGHYATTIGIGGADGAPGLVQVQTVEHLLAAVRALGLDNLLVEMDAAEVPAMDGSAAPFVSLLYAAGREGQPAARRPLWVADTIRVGDDGRWIQISPAPELRISYTLDLDHPVVGVQVVSVAPTEERFVEEVASARTYGFLKDLDLLRQQGLALGGSLDNAVVLGEESVLNGALRFRDEFVRHKILDVIGDLALLGRPVVGHVVARNAGHALNHMLVREIAQRARRAHDGVARAVSHAVSRSEGEARHASGVGGVAAL